MKFVCLQVPNLQYERRQIRNMIGLNAASLLTLTVLSLLALTSNLDRTCQTAMSAYASYGERLRVPVHAMLDRIDSSDRVSPYCEWPPTRSTATRW